ncbi:MAG: Mut7-C RNAse domain-containing protein [Thermoplasmataceae archaeon]
MRFFADSMLGKMCRWLRLMGFDVGYATSDLTDDTIIEVCSGEDLILITRDRELSIRYKNSMYITSDRYEDQLREFLARFTPDENLYFTRCPLCNGILRVTDDPNIMATLPPGVKKMQSRVYVCNNCGKVYWEGTHYASIKKEIETIVDGAGEKK